MSKKITFDVAKIDAEINQINKLMVSYSSFLQTIKLGVNAIQKGIDPVLQRNIISKMAQTLRTVSLCRDSLDAAHKALINCKDTFESIDKYLIKEYSDWIPEQIREHYETELAKKVDSAGVLQNNSLRKDEQYISRGCIITSMANLYRREQAIRDENVSVTKHDIHNANNGRVNMSWDTTSTNLKNTYGYGMKYKSGNIQISEFDKLLQEHPSGVIVYAGPSSSPHAILVTSGSNGKYKVVDPIDGGEPKPYESCWSYTNTNSAYGITGFSQTNLESVITKNCFRIAFIE